MEALPWGELGALSEPFVPADPPDDWRERPLLLRPSAAAVLVAGAAFSLTSRGVARPLPGWRGGAYCRS